LLSTKVSKRRDVSEVVIEDPFTLKKALRCKNEGGVTYAKVGAKGACSSFLETSPAFAEDLAVYDGIGEFPLEDGANAFRRTPFQL
jgi:hypothetical protein